MSITAVSVDPRTLGDEQGTMVWSDAPTNDEAIIEIEEWCRDHGLLRTHELWLRTKITENGRVRGAMCYRPSPGIQEAIEADRDAWRRHLDRLPLTPSSAALPDE